MKNNLVKKYDVVTQRDKFETILKAHEYLVEINTELKSQLTESQNRVKLLIHDGKTYTSTEITKELGLKSGTELNQILFEKGIRYKVNGTWVLTASYTGENFDSIKQEELSNGRIIYNRH